MAADGGDLDKAGMTRAATFAAFDRRLDPAGRAPLAVGLSGGSDSLALLVLALDWARSTGRAVLALTIDHGLNPDSTRWTAEAGSAARALGADWRGLAWDGPKPSTGLPAAARRARHALLADAARAVGAGVLLLGHTADDVAESDLIRRETPSHGRLSEWAPSPAWPHGRSVFLLRPLLGVRRRTLRQVLAVRGMGWLEDPANADLRFARARARRALALDLEGHGALTSTRPPDGMAPEIGSDDVVEVSPAGVISLSLAGLSTKRLACAVACSAGRRTPPSGAGVTRLAVRLAVGDELVASLAGVRIALKGDRVTLCRELGRQTPSPATLAPGEPLVFDGRFELIADTPDWRVAPLAGHAAALPRDDRRRLADIPAAARPALPVLLHETSGARLPRPFGDGPAEARELVGARLAAAIGRIDTERALARDLRGCEVHGA